ncbi:MAG: AAA family ATPase [Planctomycetes bacterium]|nr:AAA family ATPase [Planctomycetota bacterium]
MATRGLVIGKFYPPHRGHKLLIEAAQAQSDELYVIVCAKPEQRPEGELRAVWLREIHPRAKVILTPDTIDGEDSQGWAEETVRVLGFAPDVVFTSEDYGARYAGFLGCRHVLVDRGRVAAPVSGTRVRAAPLACWDFLEPPVRAHYALRICIVGAESTGKTTLAQALGEHYRTRWVPEYGRAYSEEMLARDGAYRWTSNDFIHIARTQCEHEQALARQAERVLICDTDAFATAIWHQRYIGSRCEEVEKIAAAHRRPDLYLLADAKTPFVQDGTRDGEAIREWMHRTFAEELAKDGRPFVEIAGAHEERMCQATARIEALMRKLNGD